MGAGAVDKSKKRRETNPPNRENPESAINCLLSDFGDK